MARNFSSGPDWLQGVYIVAKRLGPLTYLVDVLDGRLWKRHIVHVKKCGNASHIPESLPDTEIDVDTPVVPLPPSDNKIASDTPNVSESSQDESRIDPSSTESSTTSSHVETGTPETVETNSNHDHRSPTEPTDSNARESDTPSPLLGLPSRSYPSRSHRPPDRYGH